MIRKTKIICTLGPSTDQEDVLREMMLAGMNVARLNMSHGDHASHKARADMVKRLREELDLPIAIMLDTKGPEVRTGKFANPPVMLHAGQRYVLTNDQSRLGDENGCATSLMSLPQDVPLDAIILIDDGLIEMQVVDKTETDVVCKVLNDGHISAYKGINIPGVKLSFPFISDADRADLAFGVQEDYDFVAASFTRSAADILALRQELSKLGGADMKIIAKIENAEGVENIDEIIDVSDGIMVARGDLGVEVPLQDIPVLQKHLIAKAYQSGKQVITATQMLESMITRPRPTRAEATDVANAIYDGTSAIMLSGETAAGAYPVEAVHTMDKIAQRTEQDINYASRFKKRDVRSAPDITAAISHATVMMAHDLNVSAILTVSKTGFTARMISKFRPTYPIITGTTSKKVLRQTNLSWGVIPILIDEQCNTDALFANVVDVAKHYGYIHDGDIVVITAGVPLGISGTTNMIRAQVVGEPYGGCPQK